MQWTIDQIKALAPDASSLKSAQSTSDKRHWSGLGRNERAMWGDCKGSSSTPYGVQIDLVETAFKCTCPSRKFPCKHALALMLLAADHPDLIPQAEPPSRVASWIESRTQRAEKASKKPETVVDPVAQAKRIAQRENKILDGVQQAEIWISDLIRQGLASAQGRYYDYWDSVAARMVDAQAPGIARQFHTMAGIPASGEGWPSRLLERLSLLYLLTQGYQRIETLPDAVQAEIRSAVGIQMKEQDVLTGSGKRDHWVIMGRRIDEQEGLKTQRTWLWGYESHQPALILDFAFKNQPLDTRLIPGTIVDAEIVYYPGLYPLRAVLKRNHQTYSLADGIGYDTIQQAIDAYSQAVGRSLWLDIFPMSLTHVTPIPSDGHWHIVDHENMMLALAPHFSAGWELLALSGGHPLTVAGEWSGQFFLPLGVWVEGRYLAL